MNSIEKSDTYFCHLCKLQVKLSNVKTHETSTVHIISCSEPPKLTKFSLSESNKGYQLLKKMGWDEVSGLGPSGKGRTNPVPTTLKINRAGIGKKMTYLRNGKKVKEKSRITHFPPHNEVQKAFALDNLSDAERMQLELISQRRTKCKPSLLSNTPLKTSLLRKEQHKRLHADRQLHRELYQDFSDKHLKYLE